MNKQELLALVQESPLENGRKQQIISLLENNDLTFDIKEQIKDIIQEDIEAGTEIEFTDEDNLDINKATEQLNQDLSEIEEDLKKDLQFVEDELNDLEKITNEANVIMDSIEAEEIMKSIG